MSTGNRMKNDIANLPRQSVKKSGDVHLEPMDDTDETPHRPHRVNREDIQKNAAPPTESHQGGKKGS